jgi:hypothetical protein
MVDYSDLVARLRNAGIDASDDWVIMQVAATALEALSARERVLREALERIDSMCPVTCDMTLAHEMAGIASTALTNQDGGEKLNNPLSIAEKGV